MNITREIKEEGIAVIKINVEPSDYQKEVDKALIDFQKNTNLPGFRKGHIPMGLIRSKYGKPIVIDEVNKLIDSSFKKYVAEEKMNTIGIPILKNQDSINWNSDTFCFELEILLAPKFEIDLTADTDVVFDKVFLEEKDVDKLVVDYQESFGEQIVVNNIDRDSIVTGTFINEEHNINKVFTFDIDRVEEDVKSKFIGAKVGDQITLKSKNLYKGELETKFVLEVLNDKIKGLEIELNLTVDEIIKIKPAELDQDFFDKMPKNINNIEELRGYLTEAKENLLQERLDTMFLADVEKYLKENTNINFSDNFIKKITVNRQGNSIKEEDIESFREELSDYFIREKIVKDNGLGFSQEELKDFARENAYSTLRSINRRTNVSNENFHKMVDNIADNILKDEKESKKLERLFLKIKLMTFYKENIKYKTRKISYTDLYEPVVN